MARKIVLKDGGLDSTGDSPSGYSYLGKSGTDLSEKVGATVSAIGGAPTPEWTLVTVDISSAQILNLFSSPVQLLPAPPVNHYYSYYGYIEYTPGGTPYTGSAKPMIGDTFEYVGFILNSWWLVNSNTTKRKIEFNSVDLQGTSSSTYSGVKDATYIDKPVYFALFSGSNFTGGNGTAKIKIYYKTIAWG